MKLRLKLPCPAWLARWFGLDRLPGVRLAGVHRRSRRWLGGAVSVDVEVRDERKAEG